MENTFSPLASNDVAAYFATSPALVGFQRVERMEYGQLKTMDLYEIVEYRRDTPARTIVAEIRDTRDGEFTVCAMPINGGIGGFEIVQGGFKSLDDAAQWVAEECEWWGI